MNKPNFRFLLLLITLALLQTASLHAATKAKGHAKWPNTKTILIGDYLESTAARLDFYYTTEAVLSPTGYGTFDNYHIIADPKATTLPKLITSLRGQLLNVDISVDKHNPKIIHFVDVTLSDYTEYPLDKKASIKFSGNITDLPDQIGKATGLALYAQHIPSLTTSTPYHVDIFATNVEVRSVLTDSVVLSPKHRLIWLAQTYRTLRGPIITNVTYP